MNTFFWPLRYIYAYITFKAGLLSYKQTQYDLATLLLLKVQSVKLKQRFISI